MTPPARVERQPRSACVQPYDDVRGCVEELWTAAGYGWLREAMEVGGMTRRNPDGRAPGLDTLTEEKPRGGDCTVVGLGSGHPTTTTRGDGE